MDLERIKGLTWEKSIGKGAFGQVWLTSMEGFKNKFATKIISKQFAQNPSYKKYLNNEIQILKNISHINIINLIQSIIGQNSFYLTFEYCNGGGLSDCLEKYLQKYEKPFPENIVQHLMKQIVSAIQYLHNHKILHRDLKPDNILINFDDEEDKGNLNMMKANVKLIDFGFARYVDQNGLAQSVLGSPLYMAPQIQNKLFEKMERTENNQSFNYDQKADIWSLGTICYELLIGERPFDAFNIQELQSKMNKGNYKIPKNLKLSEESVSFINGMLQYDPKNRLDINQLAIHPFLTKNCSKFQPLTLQTSILNTKNGIWGDAQKELSKYSNDDTPTVKTIIKSLPGIFQIDNDFIDEETKIETNNNYADNNKQGNVDTKMKEMLNDAFDIINKGFFDLEPMFGPTPPKEERIIKIDF